MSATFTVSAGNTTITFTYTGPSAKAQAVALGAARNLFFQTLPPHTQAEWDALTNQQKLDVLDAYVKAQLVNLAKADTIQTAVTAAQATAKADADANLNL